jgi:hypothetical protein
MWRPLLHAQPGLFRSRRLARAPGPGALGALGPRPASGTLRVWRFREAEVEDPRVR